MTKLLLNLGKMTMMMMMMMMMTMMKLNIICKPKIAKNTKT